MIKIIQDIHVKLHPEVPWQKQHSTRRLFHHQMGLTFKEETSKGAALGPCRGSDG
jgi:hypothetical protein